MIALCKMNIVNLVLCAFFVDESTNVRLNSGTV